MRLLQRVFTDVPLIESCAFTAMMLREPEARMAEHEYMQKMRGALKPKMTVDEEGLATIPFHGEMAWNPDLMDMLYYGVEDTRNVHEMVGNALADRSVTGILADFDSPGGMTVGGFEVADLIKNSTKPVVAWSGGWMASLAYLMGSQADKIITTRTAQIGSIGAMISFADISKALEMRGIKVEMFTNKEATLKGAGVPGVPLSEAQRAHIQARTDKTFAMFREQVLSARPGIPAEAMKGQSFYGADAVGMKLADGNGSKAYAKSVLRQMTGRHS